MVRSMRTLSIALASLLIFRAVATRDPESGDLDAELTDSNGLDSGMEKELSEEAHDLPECECDKYQKGSVAGEIMCAYQGGKNCARTVQEDGSEKPCGAAGTLCKKKADSEDDEPTPTPEPTPPLPDEHSEVNEDLNSQHDETDAGDQSTEKTTSCEKGPATTKTVEIIFIVVGEEDGPKVLTRRGSKGQAMNCGGSFYMQCDCDDFHPDKDEASGACYAPTPAELPTSYSGEELDKGEANQLAYAAKKLFHTQTDPAKTISILEKKGIKRMTLQGDGNKLYRVYPMPLKSSSLLDKTVESKEFEKLKCAEIVDEANPLNVDTYFRDLIAQLRIKGCK